MRFDALVAGGKVVLPGVGIVEADVGIVDGKIAALTSDDVRSEADEVIDVSGLHVMPGVVDPHVHFGFIDDLGKDFFHETRSAASGGVTTMLGYFLSSSDYEEDHAGRVRLGEQHALVDFGFHYTIVSPDQLSKAADYASAGVSSLKYLMTSKGAESRRLNLQDVDDGLLFSLLHEAQAGGYLPCVHCENIELIAMFTEAGRRSGADGLAAWNRVRPGFAEAEGVLRAGYLAHAAEASDLYVVHLSSQAGLDAVRLLRSGRLGTRIHVETCPHYLLLSEDSPAGSYAKVNPPVRTRADQEALWQALLEGEISTIGSDHVARPASTKEKDIWNASPGFPGVATMLPLLIDEAVLNRGLPLERLAAYMSSNPARLFGLSPQKGSLTPGSDADLVCVDLGAQREITAASLHSHSGYTPFEGMKVRGWPVVTMVRGNVVYREGEFADQGHGRFVHRSLTAGI